MLSDIFQGFCINFYIKTHLFSILKNIDINNQLITVKNILLIRKFNFHVFNEIIKNLFKFNSSYYRIRYKFKKIEYSYLKKTNKNTTLLLNFKNFEYFISTIRN